MYKYRRILEYTGVYTGTRSIHVYWSILEYIQEQDLYMCTGAYTYRRILEYIQEKDLYMYTGVYTGTRSIHVYWSIYI